ncbi:hypothetical protein ALC60_13224 [Trachymyrmex zeteki]|uniref:Uncharacterized protein n=1 Tax=Mycetomoellerius zeteki TaxID=64791 RepID=A0A151WIS5_9HYME|nr:hypothetical protein ALC60_13224 [Trachymyrmex zeteki]
MDNDSQSTTHMYQHHNVLSIGNLTDFAVTKTEMDLEYPQHLHDAYTDLPFCPTREKPPGKREDKLLATLCNKQRYVIHYYNLQQCTRHGLRIAKFHRILQFAQAPWLRDYIELNTKFRTLAKNDSCIRSKLHEVYTISETCS